MVGVSVLCAVQDGHVAAARSSNLGDAHGLHVGCDLRCAVRMLRKAAVDERVDVDAEVHPFLSDDHTVRDSDVHLVGHDAFCPVAEHQPSFHVALVSHMHFN